MQQHQQQVQRHHTTAQRAGHPPSFSHRLPRTVPSSCCSSVQQQCMQQQLMQQQWAKAPSTALARLASHRRRQTAPLTVCQAGFGGPSKQKKGNSSNNSSSSGGSNQANPSACPCCSGRSYADCCRPLHRSPDPKPPTPEAALRARFSAFPKRELVYLKRSSHRDNPARAGSRNEELGKSCSWEEDLAVTAAVLRFEGLTVLGIDSDADGRRAGVRYEYSYRRVVDGTGQGVKAPTLQVARERAVFVNDDGAWLLLDSAPLEAEASAAALSAAA